MAGPLARLALAWRSAMAAWGGGAGPINWTANGGIPVGWNANFWQQNLRPVGGGDSATVNACVNAYAMTMAQLPGGHFRKLPGGLGAAERIETSAAARLLRQPNDYQTRSDFILNLVTQLLFNGNAYAWAEREGGQVAALHLMPPRVCTPYVEPESRAVFYAVSDNPLAGEPTGLVPARNVLHVRCRTHPHRPLQGITPITWAAMARDANVAIAASQAAFFSNASQPSGFISTKEKLSPEQMATLKAAWLNRTTGAEMGGVPIMAGGMEFQQMGITSQDAQLVEAFGMTVADIARAFAVPLPIIGDLSNATFNNVENLIGLWLSQGLGFYLEHLELALDRFLQLPPGEYVEFDADSLMRTAFRDRIEGLARAVTGGIYSPDEARGKEGLPPAPDGFGEEPRLQAQVVPLSAVGEPAPAAPVPAPPDPAAEPPDPMADPGADPLDEALAETERRLGDLVTERCKALAARLDALPAPAPPADPLPEMTARTDALAAMMTAGFEALATRMDTVDEQLAALPAPEPAALDVSEARAMIDAVMRRARP